MKRDILGFGVVLILFSVLLLSIPPIMAVVSSNSAFNVTPGMLYINWTNGTINLTSGSNNLTVLIDNSSTQIFSNYSQYNRYLIGDYDNLTDTTWDLCFNSTPGVDYNMKFKVQNETGSHTDTSKTLNKTNTTLFYLTPYMLCPPGKYYGYFYVRNQTNATENLTINVSMHIPINDFNTFNKTTDTGFFRGAMVPNRGYYHSFYFNTTPNDNLTGLSVTLGDSSSDIDMFLYDGSGNFLAKSINRSSSREEVVYSIPNTPDMYEIRVYGNVAANYGGYVYFSTLNITNATGSGMSSISFGELDANESSSDQVLVLNNTDDKVLTSVKENKEIYHVDTWLNQSADKAFSLLVPSFAEKIKIRLEWGKEAGENVTNWTLYLRDSEGVLGGTSIGKYLNANKTTSSNVLEEYIEYTGSITTSNDGFWNITVRNESNTSSAWNNYNLTAYIYVPDSWLTTNYSTFTFNSSGIGNYSRTVNINLTIPETNVLNGSYEGFLEYYRTSGWKRSIPISFNVRTGTLIVNENLSIGSDKVTHNVGFNTVSDPLSMKIPYNNTGGYPLYIRIENSTNNNLTQVGNSSNWIDIVLTDFPTSPLNPGASGFLNVSVKINTTKTHNKVGTYRGFVLFNTTNSTNATRQSSLFKTFNLTLYVNLTDKLNISITDIKPSYIVHPPTSANNVTFETVVRLINGTVISNANIMSYTNVTRIRIFETNVTSYNHTLTNIVSGAVGGGGGCSGGMCNTNGTVPANSVGGKFNVYMDVAWNTKMLGGTGELNLTGTGVTNNLQINQTGVKLTAISSTSFGEVNEGTQNLYFNMTIKNYGALAIPSTSKGRIYFDEGACVSQLTTVVKSTDCSGQSSTSNASGAYMDYQMSALNGLGCYVRFEIDVSNISQSNKTCYLDVISTNKKAFNALENMYMRIMGVSPGDGGDGNGNGNGGGGDECSSNSDCIDAYYCSSGVCKVVSCPNGFVSNHKCNTYQRKLTITDYESKVSVVQGDSVTTEVSVKNNGNIALDVKLDVTHNVTGVTQTITPVAYNIDASGTYSFTVKFTLSNTTKVGNHPLTLKAYVKNNESVSATKTIYLSVEPLAETRKEINQTYDDYSNLFEIIKARFLGIVPSSVSDVNFTKANRTYGSLLNMLNQAEEYLSNNQYADAADVLEDINSSLATFESQVAQLVSETSIFGILQLGDMWTWVAIGVVIVVIVGFLVYLLLPPRRGFHPVYGYRRPAKNPILEKLGKIGEKIKGIGGGVRKPGQEVGQTKLTKFEKEKYKYYAKGYSRTESSYPPRGSLAEKVKKKVKRE